MWFRRPEFDRYARFMSHGSARETFDWDEMLEVELPIPSIEKQNEIVKEYNVIVNRIKLNEQLNKKLEETAQAIYKHWFVDFEFPVNSPPLEGCPQDGVVESTTQKSKNRNTKTYKSLPYNPKLKDRAKALRKAGNLAEVLFWQQVHKGKFKGFDFDRQKIIGNYIVDFYCANVNVVVEIDGSSHDNKQEYDAKRDEYLESLGLTVIHITDVDVKNNLGFTMNALNNHPAFQQSKNDHPAFQAPLQRRGSLGYKSSGGNMVYNVELDKEIPVGWDFLPISNYITINSGFAFKSKWWTSSGLPVIKIGSIQGNSINEEKLEYVFENNAFRRENYRVKKGDIVLAMTGFTMGKIGLIPDYLPEFYINQRVGFFRLGDSNYYKTGYLFCTLTSEQFQNEIWSFGGDSQQFNVSNNQVGSIKVLQSNNRDLIEAFNIGTEEIFERMIISHKSNKSLFKMKDLLLSKMSKVELEKDII